MHISIRRDLFPWQQHKTSFLPVPIYSHLGHYTKHTVSCAQRVLRFYAGKLVARLPKTASGGTTGSAAAGTTDWHIRLTDEDVPVVCALIATAEYCHEMVGALARSASTMLDPPLGNQVRRQQPTPDCRQDC